MARPPSTVSSDPAPAAITASTAMVMETRLMNGSLSCAACSACSACSCASSAGSDMARRILFEEVEINGIGHGLVAGIIWMQLVTEIVVEIEGGGIGFVRDRRREIHHTVKCAASLDPGIHCFAHRLTLRHVIMRALERRQRRAIDLDALVVGARDD